jgi:hypothetical protein
MHCKSEILYDISGLAIAQLVLLFNMQRAMDLGWGKIDRKLTWAEGLKFLMALLKSVGEKAVAKKR